MTYFFSIVVLIVILVFTILFFFTALVGIFSRVPFVPSDRRAIQALNHITFSGNEKIVDLGSGSGTVLFALRQKYPNMHLSGYEIAILPYLYAILKNKILKANIRFHYKNFFKEDLTSFDTIFCYLMPGVLLDVVKKLQSYKKKFLFITNSFDTPELASVQKIAIEKSRLFVHVYMINEEKSRL